MPVSGSFIELPAAPLAKYPIVFLLVLLLLLHLSASASCRFAAAVTDFLGYRCAHASAQLHALQLPLRYLAWLFGLLLLFLLLNLALLFRIFVFF